jgi:RNA polymerase sigma-70 factor (ECF subfamily)
VKPNPVNARIHSMVSGPEEASETDEALMERFCRGDEAAFDALFSRYGAPIHSFLCRLVGMSAAEDITQQTFLSVVRARGRFHEGARFKPWVYAIAANAARDHLRRRRPEQLTDEGNVPEEGTAQAPLEPDAGLRRRVTHALDQLPQSQREAILLSRLEGLTFAEIGAGAGLTETAIKVRAHRGYQRLRQLLKDVWEGP